MSADINDTDLPHPPRETVDDSTRQLRELVQQRLDDYLELMRNSARAWDRRDVDSKRMLEDSTALFEFVVRDAAWWFRQAVNGVQLGDAGASTGSALNVDVPITPPTGEVTVSCSGLRHARHEQHTIPGHAIAVSPNPVPAGTTSVKVAFDPFGKPEGAYVGKLVTWTDRPGESEHYGDVVFYVGGNNQRF